MDLAQKTETHLPGDMSWLGSAHGVSDGISITLDTSAFTEADHYPDGFFTPGIVLAKINSSGLYGPYAGRANEVQELTVDATAGTYTIAHPNGEITAAIAFDATAAQVQAALLLLDAFEEGDVVVTGGPGDSGGTTPYTLTFGGQYAGENVPTLVAADVNLTGGGDSVTITQDTAGGSAVSTGLQVAKGHLLWPEKVDTVNLGDVGASLIDHGRVIEANLPSAGSMVNGGIDAAAKNALSQIRYA